MLNQEIVREATRLTRAGHFVEATALLQGMLRGKSAPDATLKSSPIALPGPKPTTTEAEVNDVENADRSDLAPPKFTQRHLFRDLLDRTKEPSKFGLRGRVKRAPLIDLVLFST